MIGIIGAMRIEIEKIRSLTENKKVTTVSGIDFVSGTLGGKNIVTAICGIGKVSAAICAQTMILKFSPSCIINTGVGGALAPDLEVCDAVIADSFVQHDLDPTAMGDPAGYIQDLGIVEIPADRAVFELLMKAAGITGGFSVKSGRIASGDQFIADSEKKKFIVDTFGASVCEMEGASIAQVCFKNSVPFSAVRAVSDKADGSGHISYSEFLPQAAENAAKIIENFVKLYK